MDIMSLSLHTYTRLSHHSTKGALKPSATKSGKNHKSINSVCAKHIHKVFYQTILEEIKIAKNTTHVLLSAVRLVKMIKFLGRTVIMWWTVKQSIIK